MANTEHHGQNACIQGEHQTDFALCHDTPCKQVPLLVQHQSDHIEQIVSVADCAVPLPHNKLQTM